MMPRPQSPPKTKLVWIALVSGVLIVGALVVRCSIADEVKPPELPAGERVQTTVGTGSAVQSVQRTSLEHNPARIDAVVDVVDLANGPVANAQLALAPTADRWVPSRSFSPVGKTGEDGGFVLAWDSLAGPLRTTSLRAIVSKPGYHTATIDPFAAGQHYRVILAKGHEFRITLESPVRQPLAGITVQLSRVSIPDSVPDSDDPALIGADPRASIVAATTNDQGTAAFLDLAAARYRWNVEDPSVWIVDADTGPVVNVPGPDLRVTVAEAYIGAVRIVGSEVVSHGWRTPKGCLNSGLHGRDMVEKQRRLRAKFDTPLIALMVPPSPTAVAAIDFNAFVSGHGWITVPATVKPLHEFVEPELFDVTARPAQPEGKLRVRIVNPDGRPIRPQGVIASQLPFPFGHQMRIRVDEECPIAPGTYVLKATRDSSLRQSLGKETFEVVAGETTTHVCRLKRPLRACRLTLRTPDGGRCTTALIGFVGDGVSGNSSLADLDDGLLWLPEGTLTIRVSAFGYDVKTSSLMVTSVDEEQTFEVRLDYAP